jgi:hypothetical protein
MMIKRLKFLAVAAITAVLVACGGGDADGADKYVGSWKGCIGTGSNPPYLLTTFNLAKTNATTLSGNIEAVGYANSACTGAILSSSITLPYRASLVDQVVIEGNTVDRVNTALDNSPLKDIYFVSGIYLYLGGGTLDAQGYPTKLAGPLIKQ